MSTAVRKASGQLLVVAIFLGILVIAAGAWWSLRNSTSGAEDQFVTWMNSGKTFGAQGDVPRALEVFRKSLALNPQNPDVHANLANAYLLANQPDQAARHAAETAHLEPSAAAGHYLLGCALLRQNQFSNAVQSLQVAKDIDRSINPVSYQLGRAYAGLGRFEDAALQFAEVTQFETNHPSAHYQLSQALLRLGRRDEAAQSLATHQALRAGAPQSADMPSLYEKCVYTEFRAPQVLEQPATEGVPVKFADDTAAVLGDLANQFHGPLGVFDFSRHAHYDVLAWSGDAGPQMLLNRGGKFEPKGSPLASAAGRKPVSAFVGDLNNDGAADAVCSGPDGTVVLRCATNGTLTDVSRLSSSGGQAFTHVMLADLEFTGRLGLVGVAAGGGQPKFLRGAGNFLLRETNQVFFADLTGASQVWVDDWNNDDLPDVLLSRVGQPPVVLANVRGGKLAAPLSPPEWPIARTLTTGDFNNDFRTDTVLVTHNSIDIFYGGLKDPRRQSRMNNQIQFIRGVDYDNDGWVDLIAWGADGLHVWRNRGRLGFQELSTALGLAGLKDVRHLCAADFDRDGDTDFLIDTGGTLRCLRNDGGNANLQLKLGLIGNRSNKSGLGVKVEAAAGGWRILRSIPQLPAEIGIGKHGQLDALNIHWFDTRVNGIDVTVDSRQPVPAIEISTVATGSCPYLYAWDGQRFRFVTDLLGGAPLGLPVASGKYVDADPEELVWVGGSDQVIARDGRVVLQITEELREVLYLDLAELWVVDRPVGEEVHSTSKLQPRGPFPPPRLLTVQHARPAQHATTLDGQDVTAALAAVDGLRVSPAQLRGPEFRGLTEPYGVVLDFGPGALQQTVSPVLVLNGWLRFGGGMANIGGSQREDFPFPFPVLEAETDDGHWVPVMIPPAAPAGKTKSLVLELGGHLPKGCRRLRLTQALEIHWDRMALGEARTAPAVQVLKPVHTDLHFRGYSPFADLPATDPATPVYERLLPQPNWSRTPSGWATRHGPVDELLAVEDAGLCLVTGGDELTLEFAVAGLAPVPAGHVREYFLHTVGWDKDADYHVAAGTTVEPLPWRGMNDQHYGVDPRPPFASDVLHQQFNTRWVGPQTLARLARGIRRSSAR